MHYTSPNSLEEYTSHLLSLSSFASRITLGIWRCCQELRANSDRNVAAAGVLLRGALSCWEKCGGLPAAGTLSKTWGAVTLKNWTLCEGNVTCQTLPIGIEMIFKCHASLKQKKNAIVIRDQTSKKVNALFLKTHIIITNDVFGNLNF